MARSLGERYRLVYHPASHLGCRRDTTIPPTIHGKILVIHIMRIQGAVSTDIRRSTILAAIPAISADVPLALRRKKTRDRYHLHRRSLPILYRDAARLPSARLLTSTKR
jgi:hypothetical protein